MRFGVWLKLELASLKRKLAVKLSMVAELRFLCGFRFFLLLA